MKTKHGALIALVLAAAGCAGTAGAQTPTPSGSNDVLYVANQDDATVTLVDASTLEVLELVDLKTLGFSANAKPHHIAVEADGSHWYVSLIGDGKVAKLDRGNRVVGVYEGFETPGMLAIDPTNSNLYVGRSMSAVNPPRRVGVVDRTTMSGEQVDVFFPRPHAIVPHPSGGLLYTASLGVNQMAVVDAADEAAALVDVTGPQHALMQFAIAPDGRTLVASGELSGQLVVFDVSDPRAPKQTGSVALGRQPFDPVFSPDGRFVWIPVKGDDEVVVVDVSAWTVVDRIEHEGFAQPHGIAFSRDGRYVFVSNNNKVDDHAMHGGAAPAAAQPHTPGVGRVVVIDAASREVVKVIPVGHNATGIGIRPRV